MLNNMQSSTNIKKYDTTTMVIPIARSMLISIKRVSAAKRYRSMAEMVRFVMEQYLKAEGI